MATWCICTHVSALKSPQLDIFILRDATPYFEDEGWAGATQNESKNATEPHLVHFTRARPMGNRRVEAHDSDFFVVRASQRRY